MKMMYAVILAALCVASQAVPFDLHFPSVVPAFEQAWTLFKAEHGKTYASVEEEYTRQKIFGENLKKIESHNYLYDMGLKSYKMGVNRFTDMENSEIKKLNGLRMSDKKINGINHLPLNNVVLPNAVDWRQKGYVTPVKDQGQCGSCWAFSSTGSMEGQHFRKTGKLVSLSEQNLMDCSTSYGNEGCSGGLMDQAFAFVKANGGIDTEVSYPYTAEDSPNCQFTKKNVGATISGFVDIQSGNETMLAEVIATIGPVSVGIDASSASFSDYSEGIYEEDTCSSVDLDHGVLVVGYGSENGKDYWIVKNSWGSYWGEKGYIRMARNKNMCGIATSASYPLV